MYVTICASPDEHGFVRIDHAVVSLLVTSASASIFDNSKSDEVNKRVINLISSIKTARMGIHIAEATIELIKYFFFVYTIWLSIIIVLAATGTHCGVRKLFVKTMLNIFEVRHT